MLVDVRGNFFRARGWFEEGIKVRAGYERQEQSETGNDRRGGEGDRNKTHLNKILQS